MFSITSLTSSVLADIVRRQPSSPARTTFAWQLAVGARLAKSTTVELTDGVLVVRSVDARWTAEINRARSVVLSRLQHLLGADCVKSLQIAPEPSRSRSL